MKVYNELEDAQDIINWAYDSGWDLDYFNSLDNDKKEYIAETIIETEEEISEVELNDILRFSCDEILESYEGDEEED